MAQESKRRAHGKEQSQDSRSSLREQFALNCCTASHSISNKYYIKLV